MSVNARGLLLGRGWRRLLRLISSISFHFSFFFFFLLNVENVPCVGFRAKFVLRRWCGIVGNRFPGVAASTGALEWHLASPRS